MMLQLLTHSPAFGRTQMIKSWLLCIALVVGCGLAVAEEDAGTPIDITGVSDPLLANIAGHLEIQQGQLALSTLGLPRSNEYILRKTRSALQAYGYYQPTLTLEGDHRHWYLTVDKGEATRWQTVSIAINGQRPLPEPLSNLVTAPPLVAGGVVNHDDYQSFKNKLLSVAQQKGFLEARFSRSQLVVAKDYSVADVLWTLDLGPRYRITSLAFSENTFASDLLQRYVDVQSGDFYDADKLVNIQQQLNRSGFFSSVGIERDIDQQAKTIAILFDIIKRPKYQLKTTLGYGTDSRGRIGVEWQDRQVNAAGHRYSIAAEANALSQSLAFVYRIPLKEAGSEWLGRASYQIKDDAVSTSKISSLESRWVLKESDFWTQQFALVIATDENSSNDTIESYLEYLVPSWQLDYYSTKDPFRATQGLHWQSVVRMSHDSISDPALDFWQWEQSLKWVHPLSENWRLLSRSTLGMTQMELDNFNTNMPTSYRFYAGGDTSVRGYRFQDLGPVNSNDEVIGGRYLLTQSLEVDWQFADNWRWAFFVDAGNAFSDSNNVDFAKSAGTGVRWVTPVGAVRIDVAKALDFAEEWRIHITIGPDL